MSKLPILLEAYLLMRMSCYQRKLSKEKALTEKFVKYWDRMEGDEEQLTFLLYLHDSKAWDSKKLFLVEEVLEGI